MYLLLADKPLKMLQHDFSTPTPPKNTNNPKSDFFDHLAPTWDQDYFISGFNLWNIHWNNSFDSCDVPVSKEFEQTQTIDTNWPCKCKQYTFSIGVTVPIHFPNNSIHTHFGWKITFQVHSSNLSSSSCMHFKNQINTTPCVSFWKLAVSQTNQPSAG